MNYQKLKKIYANDPEMITELNAREQSSAMTEQNELLKELVKSKVIEESETKRTKIEFLRGEDGHTPTEEELLTIITPLIPEKSEDGYTPIKGIDYFDGKDGETPEIDVERIKKDIQKEILSNLPKSEKGKDGKDAEPIDEEKLLESMLKTLKKKRLLDVSYIKGLEGFSKDGINYRFEELMHGGGGTGGGVITYSVDLSSQCNGVNKVFTIPTFSSIILLTGTDSPQIYKPTTDYVATGTTLTLQSGVNAPSLGATLILTYTV